MSHRIGLWIAVAALCVNAPRLVQAFLEADGLRLHPTVRPWLMGATGIAAALTLTGGGAWLAHELARGAQRLQGLLLVCWSLVLLGQLVLIPPLLMAEMSSSRLGMVLPLAWQRWAWAFVAVLLVELVAAGAMVAQGRRSDELAERELDRLELERLAAERNSLERALERIRSSEPSGLSQHRQLGQHGQHGQLGQLGQPSERQPTSQFDLAKRAAALPCRNGCGWVGSSQPAENAHQRCCPARIFDNP